MLETDFRRFRFSKLNTDEFRHLKLLIFWPIFGLFFTFVERFYNVGHYYSMHCPLDDMIPFCEWFIFPYCLWHWLLAIVGVYLLLWDAENFKRFTAFIGIGFIPVMLFDIAFPNGQDLRPTEFAQHDFFIWLLQRIYAADTNTNVLPSMHVIGCAALTLACFDSQPLCKRHLQWVALPLGLLICASTVLVKQHSILDVFVAIPVSVILYFIVYHKTFRTMRQTA